MIERAESLSMTVRFLDLDHDPARDLYWLQVAEPLCVGPRGNAFMFGGVGLAAAITAAERATARATIWASAQFLSYARLGDALDFAVTPTNAGRNVTQVRVTASVGDRTVLTVNAALGDREGFADGQWTTPPEMPPPDACVPAMMWPEQDERARFMQGLDVRTAPDLYATQPGHGAPRADGRQAVWIRLRNDAPIDAAALAMCADFVPSGLAAAFGRPGGGNSLDNTLRVVRIVPTRWVLCDIRIAAAARGFGHGAIYLFAEDGTLMASGSQSAILRFTDD